MISANTLFHFTNSPENIYNILINNFRPRYCLENMRFIQGFDVIELNVPLISFCDIPLSQINNHINTYGKYAIGLKKEWAIKNGISPVLYLYNKSNTHRIIKELLTSAIKLDKINQLAFQTNSSDASIEHLDFLFHCKDYKGEMWRKDRLLKDIIFYNEREWRYVPNLKELEKLKIPLSFYKENRTEVQSLNEKLNSFELKFTPKDIKYIIISSEKERISMIKEIENIKGEHFSLYDLKELNSKIISTEQISSDF